MGRGRSEVKGCMRHSGGYWRGVAISGAGLPLEDLFFPLLDPVCHLPRVPCVWICERGPGPVLPHPTQLCHTNHQGPADKDPSSRSF